MNLAILKAFKEKGLEFDPIKRRRRGKALGSFLIFDLSCQEFPLLIETKNNADKWPTVEDKLLHMSNMRSG